MYITLGQGLICDVYYNSSKLRGRKQYQFKHLLRQRYDPILTRRCVLSLSLSCSFCRWGYLLPRKSQSAPQNQWHRTYNTSSRLSSHVLFQALERPNTLPSLFTGGQHAASLRTILTDRTPPAPDYHYV